MSTPAAWVHGLATDLRIAIAFSTRLPVAHSVPIGGNGDFLLSGELRIATQPGRGFDVIANLPLRRGAA